MDATAADWITAGFIAVLAIFTLALAVVTGRYVEQTRLMVDEMRATREESRLARELSVLPKLAIDMETIAGMFMGLKLTNVGQGPALELQLTITFEPVEGGSLPPDVRPWRAKVLARDEWLRFVPPRDQQGELLDVPFLGQAYRTITVKGRMHDALGHEHEVDERVDDLAGLHEMTSGAMVLVEKDHVRDELRELRKSFDKAVKRLFRARRKAQEPEESEFEQEKWW